MVAFKRKKESDLINVAGVWITEKEDGSWYGSGSFGKQAFEGLDLEHFHANLDKYTVKIFPLKDEWKKEGSPDWRVYFAPKQEKTTAAAAKPRFSPKSKASQFVPAAPVAKAATKDVDSDDGLPF